MAHRNVVGGATVALAALGMAGTAGAEEQAAGAVRWDFGAHTFADWTEAEPEAGGSFEDNDLTLLRFDATRAAGPTTLVLEADISQNEFTVHDAFLDWRLGAGGAVLRVGHFKEPNGLEQVSALYGKMFVRGPGLFKINGIDRRLGASLRGYNGPFTFEGALFASNINEEDLSNGWSASARAVYGAALGGQADHIVHLAVSTRYREADDSRLGLSEDAYSFAIGKIVKTGAIADSDIFLGAEAAYQAGSFSLQGEASRSFVDCASAFCGGGDPSFDAAYVDASYVFGGHRNYRPRGGKFGRYAIDHPLGEAGGWGAFELAARLDYADLVDNGVLGGQQTTTVVGATYHANNNVRFQLNYAHSEIEAPTTGLSSDVDAMTLRMQIDLSARR